VIILVFPMRCKCANVDVNADLGRRQSLRQKCCAVMANADAILARLGKCGKEAGTKMIRSMMMIERIKQENKNKKLDLLYTRKIKSYSYCAPNSLNQVKKSLQSS
jgi:hypothetical protein